MGAKRRFGVGLGLVMSVVLGVACSGKSFGEGREHVDAGDPWAVGGDAGGAGEAPFLEALAAEGGTKLDLLLMVDNSSSMAGKQAIFAEAVPELMQRLVSPRCVSRETGLPLGDTPQDPDDPCPDPGAVRELRTVTDIHVGIITSSLGGHGSSTCEPRSSATALRAEMEDDRAELIGARPRFGAMRSPGGQSPTPQGFLDWSPDTAAQSLQAFNVTFQDMTRAAGEYGCGFEAQLESIYRFLVDPEPPSEVTLQPCPGAPSVMCATKGPVNTALLAQRQAFLRPDSLVAVVMLTDENDCSIRDDGQSYFAARQDITLGAASICSTDPNNACCYSCLQAPPSGCPADPICGSPDPELDPPNLRCFNQKQRFGIDLLYPTERYVNALTERQICPEREDLDCSAGGTPVPNPLFTSGVGAPRDPSLVLVAGIVGVPWQDLQAAEIVDASGERHPVPPGELHYVKTSDPAMDDVWNIVLGNGVSPPRDALMREAISPRPGDGPISPSAGALGQVRPPSAGPLANPANGHEYDNSRGEDLQYACIFRLPQPMNCADYDPPPVAPGQPQAITDRPFCDCSDVAAFDRNPLCQADDGSYSRTQVYGKAYPSLRELQVLQGLAPRSVVASICARNTVDASRQDYGHRPAVDALVSRLKEGLGQRCLPVRLEVDDDGRVPCRVVEVRPVGESCDADEGRTELTGGLPDRVRAQLRDEGVCGRAGLPACSTLPLCEIGQVGGACLEEGEYAGTPGWCYVDPLPPSEGGQSLGDPGLVAGCPEGQERRVRFVDAAGRTPAPGSRVLFACVDP